MESYFEIATYVLVFLTGVLIALVIILVTDHNNLKRDVNRTSRRGRAHSN